MKEKQNDNRRKGNPHRVLVGTDRGHARRGGVEMREETYEGTVILSSAVPNPPPWETEPDHVLTEAHGFVIEIKRHPTHKHLTGYIYIKDTALADYCTDALDVHGGWTYQTTDQDVHVLGFDCAHAGDLCPGILATTGMRISSEVYRTMDFVLNELQVVAKKLADRMSARKEKQDEHKLRTAHPGA
jgi:hypothetical protein